jgi:hypothetical protein
MSVFLLVDDHGALYDASRAEVRERLGRRGDTLNIIAGAVRKLRWVGLVHHASSIEIHLRSTSPAPQALQVAIDLLMGTLTREVVVVHCGKAWIRERFPSPAEAVLRIEELTASATSRKPAAFRATPRALQDLWRDGNRSLIMALQQFQMRLGSIDLADARILSRHTSMGMTGVIERAHGSGELIIRSVSPLMRFYRAKDRPALEGREFRHQPNRDYCDWISQSYSRAIESGQPLVEDVDAVIRGPDGRALQTSYRRLVAPYRTQKSSHILLATSELIPLPRRAAAH